MKSFGKKMMAVILCTGLAMQVAACSGDDPESPEEAKTVMQYPISAENYVAPATYSGAAFDSKIMTLNLKNTSVPISAKDPEDGISRGDKLHDLINDVLPDSMGFQECTEDWKEYINSSLLTGYRDGVHYATAGYKSSSNSNLKSGSNEYSPILYRADKFTLKEEGGYWYSETPDKKSKYMDVKDAGGIAVKDMAFERVFSYAVFNHKDSDEIAYIHINTHLDHQAGAEIQLLCAEQLIAFANELRADYNGCPVVMTGDYNDVESERSIKLLSDPTNGFNNAMSITQNTDSIGTSCGYGEDYNDTKKAVIDYLFSSADDISVYSREVHVDPYLSDHSAVIFKLRMNELPVLSAISINGTLLEKLASNRNIIECTGTGSNLVFTVAAPKGVTVSEGNKILKGADVEQAEFKVSYLQKKRTLKYFIKSESGFETVVTIKLTHKLS